MLTYPARLDPGPEGEVGFTVTFRDIPEAITEGESRSAALAAAEDCLDVALAFYVEQDLDLPKASEPRPGEAQVAPSLAYALKFAVYQAMRDERVEPAELARRMGLDHKAVSQRLLKLNHKSPTWQMEKALKALGRKPRISVEAA